MTSANHVCLLCMRETPLPLQYPCPFCSGDDRTLPIQSPALPPHTILDQRYLLGRTLGQGGFGITYQAYDLRMGNIVAIKEYFPSSLVGRDSTVSTAVTLNAIKGRASDDYASGLRHFLYEARRQAKLATSAGVVSVNDFFQANNTAYYVMEYVDGCTLVQHLKNPISIQETLTLLESVADSLICIHSAGLIHRDISPDNIMCTQSGQTKLLDFGASHSFTEEESTTVHATLKHGFAPPEQYGTSNMQGPWTDIYAFCATIYWCLTGKIPQDSMDRSIGSDLLRPPSELGASIYTKAEAVLMRGLALPITARYQDMDSFWKRLKKAAASDDGTAVSPFTSTGFTAPNGKTTVVPTMETPEQTKIPEAKPKTAARSDKLPFAFGTLDSPAPTAKVQPFELPEQSNLGQYNDDDVKIAPPIVKKPRPSGLLISEEIPVSVPDNTVYHSPVTNIPEQPAQSAIHTAASAASSTRAITVHFGNRILVVLLAVLVVLLVVFGFLLLRHPQESPPETSVEDSVVTIHGMSYPITTTELCLTANTTYTSRYRSHVSFDEVPYLSASDWQEICKLTSLKKLYLVGLNLTSLAGLEQLSVLEILDVSKNSLTDLSPLTSLSNLKELYAAENNLTFCPTFSSLAYLDLSGNAFSDVSCLGGMQGLTALYLQKNQIATLEPLRRLSSLFTLDVAKNHIGNLSPLSDMGNLKLLYVEGNPITNLQLISFRAQFPNCALDVDVLTDIPNEVRIGSKMYSTEATGLNLASSGLQDGDIENLKYMLHLTRLDLSGNDISDVSMLSRLYSLTFLSLSYNNVSDISPLSGLTNLTTLSLSSNEIADLSSLQNLTNLESLSIGENLFSDLSPLSNMNKLSTLAMYDCQAQNLESLYSLSSLRELRISRHQYASEQISELQNAIPYCTINQY